MSTGKFVNNNIIVIVVTVAQQRSKAARPPLRFFRCRKQNTASIIIDGYYLYRGSDADNDLFLRSGV